MVERQCGEVACVGKAWAADYGFFTKEKADKFAWCLKMMKLELEITQYKDGIYVVEMSAQDKPSDFVMGQIDAAEMIVSGSWRNIEGRN